MTRGPESVLVPSAKIFLVTLCLVQTNVDEKSDEISIFTGVYILARL